MARARYFQHLRAVEIASTFLQLPRRSTLERWRRDIPPQTQLSVSAWRPLTHPCASGILPRLRPRISRDRMLRYGHFRSTPEVREAWSLFGEALELLRPNFVLFRTPATFYPGADPLRDMYRFFKDLRRGGASFVWMPDGKWEARMIRQICRDLNLIHGTDPLAGAGECGGVHYFRLAGRTRYDRTCSYTDDELRTVYDRCAGKAAYVFFATHAMWKDAQRFQALVDRGGRRDVRHRGRV
ncbi:MAG: DUF72 domain-containing protein [Elusimicrobiota bacterium]